MKKILLATLITGMFSAAYAYPNVDMTVGGFSMRAIQQQNFQKLELNDYKEFKDANEKPVTRRTDSPKQMQQEYSYKQNLQPTRIQLGGQQSQPQIQEFNTSDMQFVNEDGKIKIEYRDY